MSLLSLGLTRGLIGQLIGLLTGMVLLLLGRLLLGYDTLWYAEGAWSLGALCSIIGFMIGVGALDVWFNLFKGIKTPIHHGPPVGQPAWARYFSVDTNHKVIGIQYAVTGLILLMIGGGVAVIFRTELAHSGFQLLDPTLFNTLVGLHGWIAISSIFIGSAGMANYLIPLMIGADDMAFPHLNAFGFWIGVPGIVLLLMSLLLKWDSGWTLYPPLSLTGSVGYQLVFYAVYAVGLSSIFGSLNLIATVLLMRAPGMSLFRMPIFCWGVMGASLIQLTETQLIGLAMLLLSLERSVGMGFFSPIIGDAGGVLGGNPLLFQHLFWFYSHPVVYVWVLPGLGIISEILPVFARKPLFGYRWVALSSIAISLLGMLVWGHHMFASGYADQLRVWFMLSTMLIAIPTGVKFFSWIGTLWGGRLTFPTPMLFALGAISIFLLGGLSGPILATVSTDLFLTDTYFIVGHFHATIFGGFIFPFFAAIYFWYPKVTGRMYNERLGQLHFWIMTPAFWVMSIGQMSVGAMGMRRRIVDYDPALGIDGIQLAVTIAAFAIAISVLLMIHNLFYSADLGEIAGANPWHSRSPEWQIPSPVPEHSYPTPVTIVGEPYDYELPGSRYVNIGTAAGDD